MLNRQQRVLIQKDIREVTSNNRLFVVMWLVPLIFTVVMPLIMMLAFALTPESAMDDLQAMIRMIPQSMRSDNLARMSMNMAMQYVFPMYFLLIPIMVSSVMASSSFVGEKERRTLETLLFSPLTVTQVFVAKVAAAFIVSQAVMLFAFTLFMAVMAAGGALLMGGPLWPGWTWLPVMLLISPAVGLLGIIITVRMSAKAKTSEEAQQRSAFMVLPLVLLATTQMSGLFLMGPWLLTALGVAVAALDFALLSGTMKRFNPEALLR